MAAKPLIPDFTASQWKTAGKSRDYINQTSGERISKRQFDKNRRAQVFGSPLSNEKYAKQNVASPQGPGPARGRKGVRPTNQISPKIYKSARWHRSRLYKTERGAYNFARKQSRDVTMLLVGKFEVVPTGTLGGGSGTGSDGVTIITQAEQGADRLEFHRFRPRGWSGPGVIRWLTLSEGTFTRSGIDDVWPDMERVMESDEIIRLLGFEIRWRVE